MTTTEVVPAAAPAAQVPAAVDTRQIEKLKKELSTFTDALVATGNGIIEQCDPDDEGTIERVERFITGEIKAARERVKLLCDPLCQAANTVHKLATAARAALDDPLAELERDAKQASLDARKEINRRIEEQREAEAAAAKKAAEEAAEREAEALRQEAEEQRQEAEAEAERLRAAGKADEAQQVVQQAEQAAQHRETVAADVVQEAQQAPVQAFAQPVRRSVPTSGVSYAKEWYAEVNDIKALCAAVANGTAPEDAVSPNMVKLNAMATAMKSALKVPGVAARERDQVSARRRG